MRPKWWSIVDLILWKIVIILMRKLLWILSSTIETNILRKMCFLFNDERHYGIDNIYIGNINTQHKLSKKFIYELDEILKKKQIYYKPRVLVYRINYMLFYYTNVILHDTHVKYKRPLSHNYSKNLLSAL